MARAQGLGRWRCGKGSGRGLARTPLECLGDGLEAGARRRWWALCSLDVGLRRRATA